MASAIVRSVLIVYALCCDVFSCSGKYSPATLFSRALFYKSNAHSFLVHLIFVLLSCCSLLFRFAFFYAISVCYVCLVYLLGSPILLFATHKDIRMANVSRSNKVNIIVKDLSEGVALDFYHERGLVCWSDSSLEMIQCIRSNGTHAGERMTVVNSSLISPDGLACDWYTGKLYWTDGEKNRIEVTSIDGRKDRKVLFWTEIYQPRAIALAPMWSLMFWTDWGEVPKIERAAMDGDPSTRMVIVSDDIFWPNGLTVDYENELIYWADGRLWFIAVMDYYGKNRRKIISHGLDYPFAITYFDSRLFWTDWKTWCIHTYDMRQSQAHPRELFHGEYIPGE